MPAPRRRGGLFHLWFPLALLTVVTLLSYANAWPDAVVLDDKFFVNNPQLPDWSEPEEMFKGDVWRTTTSNSGLFRPALFVSLSIDSWLFGGWLRGYHISNIVLHLLTVLTLYGFLMHLLRAGPQPPRRADAYALLAALVFAVHPVHSEAINSVFNRSDMMVTFFGVIGTWWLLRLLWRKAVLAWTGFAACYFMAMLCKETGVVLPGIAAGLILFLSDESAGKRIRRGLQAAWMVLPLALYFYLRYRALHHGGTGVAYAAGRSGGEPRLASLADPDQLLATLGYWGEGLRLMVWPHPLRLFYDPPEGLAWTLLMVLQGALILLGVLQLRKGRSVLLAGLAWYYLSLLPAARLVVPGGGETASALSERFLYFASVGPTLVLAFAIAWLGRRYGAGKVLLPVMLSLVVMMPVTWIRNNDWRTDVALFEKEYRVNPVNPETLRLVTAAHQKRGNRERGVEICDRYSELFVEFPLFALNCGMIYDALGRMEDAEHVFLIILEDEGEFAAASAGLALVYLRQGRYQDAIRQFNKAVEDERDPAIREMRHGMMLGYLYPNDIERLEEARQHFEKAYELQPMLGIAKAYAQGMERVIKSLQDNGGAAGTDSGSPAPEAEPGPNSGPNSGPTPGRS